MKNRIAIMIANRDRPTELALLLQSLRTQTHTSWDLLICDDCSGTPLQNYYFLGHLINRMKFEGHSVFMFRNNFVLGVSKTRQFLVDKAKEFIPDTELYCRIDDDTILQPNYLTKLLEGIEAGYDLVGSLTPPISAPEHIRQNKYVKPIINRVVLDEEGNFVVNADDCGHCYIEDEIIPCHHFRSSCLYKKEIHDAGIDYKTNLSKSGMREEEIFSFKCILKGFKLAVHTGAIHYHMLTPSGGQKTPDYNELMLLNEEILKVYTKDLYKEHGDFLTQYNERLKIKDSEEDKFRSKNKNTNFIIQTPKLEVGK